MNSKELADKLYEMAKDMDFGDYVESYDIEINVISNELEKSPCLRTLLETIVNEWEEL